MWFGVLGALEVRAADGRAVRLAGPVRRQLLAALLCRAGRAVPAAVLVTDLWGELPPRSAAKTLQSHMVRLRDDLGRDGTSLVRTDVDGYRVDVTPDQVDALRFEALLRTADDLDPDAELARLDEALQLWRGDAYREFGDAAFAVAERQRLTELRAGAQERHTDVGLALGRAQELVPELEARVAAEPYRERTWEQLILALYRSGRQADALGAFRRIRDLLAADLGVDPGPALRELEARVLHQDNGLLAAALPRVAPASGPARCPYPGLAGYGDRDASVFVGRERLTAELAGLLATRRVVLVTGPSGCGKTSLLHAGLLPGLRSGALPGSASWRAGVVTPGEIGDVAALPSDLIVVDQTEELFTVLSPQARAAAVGRLVAQVESGVRLVLAIRGDFVESLAQVPELAALARTTLLVRPMRDDEIRRAVVEPAVRAGCSVEPDLLEVVLDDVSGRPGALPLLSAALVRTWENRDGQVLTLAGYRAGGGLAGALEASAEDSYAALPDHLRPAARRMLVRLTTRGPSGWVRRPLRRTEVGDGDEADALDVLVRDRLVTAERERVELVHEALLTGWPRLRGWLDERAHASELLEHLAATARSWDAGARPASDLYRGARLQSALDWANVNPEDVGPIEADFLAVSEAAAQADLTEARARADREAAGRRRLRVVVGLLAAVVVATLVAVVVAVRERAEARRQAQRAATAAVVADARRLAAEALTAPDLRTAMLLAVASYRLDPSADTRAALMSALERNGTARWRVSTPQRVLWVGAPASGSEVLAADNQGDVLRYDTETRRLIGSCPDHAGRVHAVSPDGRLLVVSGTDGTVAHTGDGTVRLLDAATGATLDTLATPTPAGPPGWHTALFTGDGHHLALLVAAAADVNRAAAQLAIYDMRHLDRAPRMIHLDGPGTGIATGADTVAVSTSKRTVEVVEAGSGRVLHAERVRVARRPSVVSALSPDGTELAIGNDSGTVLSLVPAAAPGSAGRPAPVSVGFTEAAFSPDGRELAVGGVDGSVAVLSSATARPVHDLRGDSGQVLGVAWAGSARAPSLFSGGLDSQVVSWDLTAGSRLVHSSGPAMPGGVYGAVDGVLVGVEPTPQDFGGSAGPSRLAAQRIELRTGHVARWPLGLSSGDQVSGIGSDPAGRYAVLDVTTAQGVKRCDVWDAITGRRVAGIALHLPRAATGGCTVDRQAHRAVIATGEHALTVYRLPAFTPIRTVHVHARGPVAARAALAPAVFATDGELLAAGVDPGGPGIDAPPRDQMLLSIDPRTGAVTGQASLGAAGYLESVAFSPDHSHVLVGDDQGNISLFARRTLRRVAAPAPAADGYVYAATFSPDGQTIATTGTDSTIRLFDAATLAPIGAPITMPGADWVFGGYDGRDEVAGLAPGPRPGTQQRFVLTTAVADWIRTACTIAGSGFSHAEWQRYVGDRPFQATCATP